MSFDDGLLHALRRRTGAGQQECSDALERFDGDAALAEGYLAYVHASSVARPHHGTCEAAEARLGAARRRAEQYGGGDDEQQR